MSTQLYLPADIQKPELILVCQVNPSFRITKQLEKSLKKILQTSVESFEFWHACLFLVSEGTHPLCCPVARKKESPGHFGGRWAELYEFMTESEITAPKLSKWLELMQPAASTTLPVILQAGDPVGKMEIGIFGADPQTARYMLVKAVSLGRHMADIIQESIFRKQKNRYLRKLAVWLEMVNTISSTLDIHQALHVVTQLTADLFSARCCIYLLDESTGTLIPAVAVGSYDPDLRKKFKSLKGCQPFPAITRTIRTQRPLIITPTNIHRYLPADIIRDFQYHQMVMAPISSKGKTLGVMQIDRPEGVKGFDQEDAEIIFAIARATAIAMENARLIEMLGQKEQMLHQLVNKLITAQEDERKRLASDLHDGIIQSLIAIWYRLQRISPSDQTSPVDWYREIEKLTGMLGEQIQEIRRILYNLRPIILDNYGLIPAIESYTAAIQEQHDLSIEFKTNVEEPRLDPKIEITLFRILQEALTNVVKHARATMVKVELDVLESEVTLRVADNGLGLDKEVLRNPQGQNRLGLASIHERALLLGGTCNIESSPERGTSITVKIPLKRY